ncbi:MAG: ATP-binding cassette domain-containing protein [Parachlamydiaceae bacterium]
MIEENSSAAVDVCNLTHWYNATPAVDDISFKIVPGTTFGLIGPNGAGKSTTIKMLTTLLPVTSGTASVNGHSVTKEPSAVRQSIGYVPQLVSTDGDLTAYENLLFSAKLYGLPKKERENRIHEVLNFMDLGTVANQLTNTFSGGLIRRLEVAQALIHQPRVLFLDEPTVGLDPAARKALWNYIEDLKKRLGMTILMTTHDMDEADTLCDVVALMNLGRIVVMDTPRNLKAALGPEATLNDVFILHTGNSLNESGGYHNVKQIRTTISHL